MKRKRISQKDFFSAAGLAVLSSLCVAIAAGLWQFLTTLGAVQIVLFARFFFPFILVAIWAVAARQSVRIRSVWPHLLRALLVTVAQWALLWVLAHSTLLLAILLYSTSALFAPLLTALFLKVRASRKALLSIIVSFVGVAVALGTWSTLLTPVSWIGLASGLLTAAAQIVQHRTSKTDSPIAANFVLFGTCTAISLIIIWIGSECTVAWDQIHWPVAFVILGFSVLTLANQTLKSAAFKLVHKATTLMPFFYASILFSGLIDWIWHRTVPELHTILGVCLIISGGTILSIRRTT